jgi:hypothetical protein
VSQLDLPTAPMPHGLAFDATGTRLFVVTAPVGGGQVVLHVVDLPLVPVGRIALSRSARTVTYGRNETLTAQLGPHSTNTTLRLYATPAGGSESLVGSKQVNGDNQASWTVWPHENTTYRVEWDGDSAGRAAHASTTVLVHARLTGRLSAGYRTLAGYHLYHYRLSCALRPHVGCPTFTATVSPNHAGARVSFALQVWRGYRWVAADSATFRLGVSSRAKALLFYSRRGAIGARFRVRASFAGDARNLGSQSAWSYYRITA